MGTDRNKVAKEVRVAEDLQVRRRFISLLLEIRQIKEAMDFQEKQRQEFMDQFTGKITEKDQHGNLLTDRSLRTSVISLKHTIEKFNNKLSILKEDVINLMKGRSIKTFQEETREHYKKIDEFYEKNIG